MSTDLTTTILLGHPVGGDTGLTFRFIRTSVGRIRIQVSGEETAVFSPDDAIMLRDWLNDEWPVERREVAEERRRATDWWRMR